MKRFEKIVDVVMRVVFAVLILFWAAVFWRVFVADRFVIPSDSMSPTFQCGDRIVVDNLSYGTRIYKDYDFHGGMDLKCFRVKVSVESGATMCWFSTFRSTAGAYPSRLTMSMQSAV